MTRVAAPIDQPDPDEALAQVRARLSAAQRARGPLTVRRAGPAAWIIEGSWGTVAVARTEPDAQLVAHASADLRLLLGRVPSVVTGGASAVARPGDWRSSTLQKLWGRPSAAWSCGHPLG